MDYLKIMLACLCVSSTHCMEQKEPRFEDVWPFKKLETKYDDMFSSLIPLFFSARTNFEEPSLFTLQVAQNYLENDDENCSAFSLEQEKILRTIKEDAQQKKKALKIISFVLLANHTGWRSSNGSTLGWSNIFDDETITKNTVVSNPAQRDKAIIGFHGLGDTGLYFEQYLKFIDPTAATFVPDFYDKFQKPLSISTELELLMGAYEYFIARKQLQKLYGNVSLPLYLLGFSRGAGVVARLMSKFKKGQEPADGFVLLAPFIDPAATISHAAKETSVKFSSIGLKMPEWLVGSSLKSANAISEDLIEINPKKTAVTRLDQPILIIHGDNDKIIPPQKSAEWALEHATIGNKVFFRKLKGADHNDLFENRECLQYIHLFLNKNHAKFTAGNSN